MTEPEFTVRVQRPFGKYQEVSAPTLAECLALLDLAPRVRREYSPDRGPGEGETDSTPTPP